MNKTAVIIVTYNRKELLMSCLEAVKKQSVQWFNVLVVDNASTDGTREYLEEQIKNKEIIYCNTGSNLGGAGGFQYGVHCAVHRGYDYLWLMDDDCIPERDALEKLMDADKELGGDYGFLSSVAYWTDGSLCNMNIQRSSMTKKIKDLDQALIPAVMATFVSVFLKASVVRQVGLPIKEFFIWSDDLEYTRRISLKYKSYVVAGSRVLHAMKSNEKVNIALDSSERLDRYLYLYRNEVYVYKREGAVGMAYLTIRMMYHLVKILVQTKELRFKKIQIVLKSFISGFSFHPEIEFVNDGKGHGGGM